MSKTRIVPVAYVTRWSTTAGIRIVRGGEETTSGALMARSGIYVSAPDWTESKADAEKCYRAKVDAARLSALRKAEKLEEALNAPPKYMEG